MSLTVSNISSVVGNLGFSHLAYIYRYAGLDLSGLYFYIWIPLTCGISKSISHMAFLLAKPLSLVTMISDLRRQGVHICSYLDDSLGQGRSSQ